MGRSKIKTEEKVKICAKKEMVRLIDEVQQELKKLRKMLSSLAKDIKQLPVS